MRYVLFFILAFTVVALKAQEEKPVIQFTGVVMGEDSLMVIPGVHVYVPKGGRGTTTNPYGFFSMPAIEGDSIIFSSVGFKRTHFIIPRHDPSTSLKVLVTLIEDITFLDEVEVFPFPTEEMFKHAVVTMQLPYDRESANLQAWLNATYLKNGQGYLAASPASNQQYYSNRRQLEFQNKFAPPQNNLLNPCAWASFINSLKRK